MIARSVATPKGGVDAVAHSYLIGRPDWYLGLQPRELGRFDVVDTAKWIGCKNANHSIISILEINYVTSI